MTNQNETATTVNSDGNEIGLCVNCEHAALEPTHEICATCHDDNADKIFTNFKKAADKPESKHCNTCRNNPEIPLTKGTRIDNHGFPCNICANEYFYDPI